ncbi:MULTISPECIES: DUF4265 domain-containing protein [Trichocoleus]|uniref:DUF4265 domain-containing protein n=1 Tax=Trichocoleus desertorum GB2-A4 TaxID=2933944 RepID=A0ABV0JEN6_9CYAN|nr:DUF4265 domain-containing protein [Trichocoleus sp. FACHB-46]MBD1864417.1 DUF4265 domain-containing protein [Trichocoleus sp. FACHB-46]
MTFNQEPKLVKIVYILPEDDESAAGEGLWAYALGDQLYELQNIPVCARHLNVEDIVRCEELPGERPLIKELVRRSGNQTLRVIFSDEAPEDDCVDIIIELRQRGIQYEKPAFKCYMFNIPPDSDYEWARDFLRAKEEEGLLCFDE